jgi:putative FmdB family regulatory protein
MPTYQYQCQACNHEFEVLQSISAPKLRKCPQCKRFKLQRLIGSGSSIIFKGSGFYETDYKRKFQECAKETSSKGTDSSACTTCPYTASNKNANSKGVDTGGNEDT